MVVKLPVFKIFLLVTTGEPIFCSGVYSEPVSEEWTPWGGGRLWQVPEPVGAAPVLEFSVVVGVILVLSEVWTPRGGGRTWVLVDPVGDNHNFRRLRGGGGVFVLGGGSLSEAWPLVIGVEVKLLGMNGSLPFLRCPIFCMELSRIYCFTYLHL